MDGSLNEKNMADIMCNHKKRGVKKICNCFCTYAIEDNRVA